MFGRRFFPLLQAQAPGTENLALYRSLQPGLPSVVQTTTNCALNSSVVSFTANENSRNFLGEGLKLIEYAVCVNRPGPRLQRRTHVVYGAGRW